MNVLEDIDFEEVVKFVKIKFAEQQVNFNTRVYLLTEDIKKKFKLSWEDSEEILNMLIDIGIIETVSTNFAFSVRLRER